MVDSAMGCTHIAVVHAAWSTVPPLQGDGFGGYRGILRAVVSKLLGCVDNSHRFQSYEAIKLATGT